MLRRGCGGRVHRVEERGGGVHRVEGEGWGSTQSRWQWANCNSSIHVSVTTYSFLDQFYAEIEF